MRNLAFAAATLALILAPVSAQAKPRVDHSCAVTAVHAKSHGLLVCGHDGPTANSIDWD